MNLSIVKEAFKCCFYYVCGLWYPIEVGITAAIFGILLEIRRQGSNVEMLTYIQKDLVEPLVGLDLLLRRQNVRFDLEKSFAVIDFEDLKNQDNGVTFP